MVLIDKKILGGGIAMLIVGLIIIAYLNSTVPIGTAGMTEEQTLDLMKREAEHKNYSTLAAMLAGVGFLLVLISFGARRKKGGAKTIEKKPSAPT
ncbi:MAG: hypothetical protein EB170_04315 [Nitrosopumilaceae archaeon]|nr:hypothetical protein [Nitrososphaeria archaeon]NDB63078.1 hypothetical protein [Nitrosopumilaceae archaeon]NDF47787.1 hypothetical protein [Nitrosopumilaceae archaeon]